MSNQKDTFNIITALSGQNRAIVVNTTFIDFVGDYEGAAMLSQLLFLSSYHGDDEDWFWHSHSQWFDTLRIKKKKSIKIIKTLKDMGFLETKIQKVNGNPTLHYKIDQDLFIEQLTEHINQNNQKLVIPKREKGKSSNGTNGSPSRGLTHLVLLEQDLKTNYVRPDPPSPPSKKDLAPQKEKPSSFVLPEEDLKHDLANLMQIVPEDHRSSDMKKRLTKALLIGHLFAYLLDCIAYTTQHATDNYLSYLSNCIDKGYAPEGYSFKQDEERAKQIVRDNAKELEMKAQIVKQKIQQEEQEKLKQKYDFVDNLQKEDPDQYKALSIKACENLGINPDALKTGDSIKMRLEIFKILGL